MDVRAIKVDEDQKPHRPDARTELRFDLSVRPQPRLKDVARPRCHCLGRRQHSLSGASEQHELVRRRVVRIDADHIQAVFSGGGLCEQGKIGRVAQKRRDRIGPVQAERATERSAGLGTAFTAGTGSPAPAMIVWKRILSAAV